jgi:hypothetical protein
MAAREADQILPPLYRKYAHLARVVANLDAAQVSHMFRSSRDPMAFYPATGLYAYEFALGYVLNKVGRRAAGRTRGKVPDVESAMS